MKFSGCYGDIQTKTADFKSFICKGWRCKNYRNNFIFKQNHDFKRRFQDAMVTSRQESLILNHSFARDGCAKIVKILICVQLIFKNYRKDFHLHSFILGDLKHSVNRTIDSRRSSRRVQKWNQF